MVERWRDLKLSGESLADSSGQINQNLQFSSSAEPLVNPSIGRGLSREKTQGLRLPASLAALDKMYRDTSYAGLNLQTEHVTAPGMGRGQVVHADRNQAAPVGYTRVPKAEVRVRPLQRAAITIFYS